MLIARATQIVWTCSPSSGATPLGSASWKSGAADGALAANNWASAAFATNGAVGVVGPGAAADDVAVSGIAAFGCGCFSCAWNMATETAIDAATASHRPLGISFTM